MEKEGGARGGGSLGGGGVPLGGGKVPLGSKKMRTGHHWSSELGCNWRGVGDFAPKLMGSLKRLASDKSRSVPERFSTAIRQGAFALLCFQCWESLKQLFGLFEWTLSGKHPLLVSFFVGGGGLSEDTSKVLVWPSSRKSHPGATPGDKVFPPTCTTSQASLPWGTSAS